METVIERIRRGHFWKFHGGIHPPEQKFLTQDKPIRCLPLPKQLILPLQQHIGHAGELLVQEGDTVLTGQALTSSTQPMVVPIHAPTSGTITAIKMATVAHPSGLSELCLFITPDRKDQWVERNICLDFHQLTKTQIIDKIAQAGISGMGGAGFPTAVKVATPVKINYLIINAAECEPYITADDLLIREHCATIVNGINILDHILSPTHILIGIEDNKPEAIKALQNAIRDIAKIHLCILPTKYPTGGEKQLIKILTGEEIPSGALPISRGMVMQNIATCFAIADAVINDIPLLRRVVTVTGQALEKPQNVWALFGTPVSYLLEQCHYKPATKQHIIMGGPMMGFSLKSDQVPIIKTTNCLLVPSETEISAQNKEVECIRCGQCADVCPSQLLPQELQWSAKAKDQQKLEKLNLFDCIECGACAYVCPSQIPLVHYYRIAKAEIREQKQLDIRAEKAKTRFEMRKSRLEREKRAREEKHKKAAEARHARMNADTPSAKNDTSAIAAALARVKAKKALASNQAATPEAEQTPLPTGKNSQVAAAIARAKAKKAAASNHSENKEQPLASLTSQETVSIAPNEDKPAQQSAEINKSPAPDTDVHTNINDSAINKQARIALAVAKAKEKALAKKQQSTVTSTEVDNGNRVKLTSSSSSLPVEEKTPHSNEENIESNSSNLPDERKARVAAAVAKAKAKKLLQKSTSANAIDSIIQQSEAVTNSAEQADKKARVALAIAKAKAKKLQQESP